MTVELIIDHFINADAIYDLYVEKNRASIRNARLRINENLEAGTYRGLTVCLSHEGLLEYFSDFSSVKGVKITYAYTPIDKLRETLDSCIPVWLTNQLLVDNFEGRQGCNLLPSSLESLYRILFGFDEDSYDFSCFLLNLVAKTDLVKASYQDDSVIHFWLSILNEAFDINALRGIVSTIVEKYSPRNYLEELSFSKQVMTLRDFSEAYKFSVALPASTESIDILEDKDLLIQSKKLDSLVGCAFKLFEFCINSSEPKIRENNLKHFPLIPIQSLLEAISDHIVANFDFSYKDIIDRLLVNLDSSAHRAKLESLLKISEIECLGENSTVDQVSIWLDKYFDGLQESWETGSILPLGIETSFSDWLLKNLPRVERSNNNWTSISQSIQLSLDKNDIVVVYMIDALSGAHLYMLEDYFTTSFKDMRITAKRCFSPIPTLTEVCKNSVLTGKFPSQVKGESERAVLKRYANSGVDQSSLLTHKSWNHTRPPLLNENTNLYLFLENRLDDNLHDSKAYEEFSKYIHTIKSILSQISSHIQKVKSAAFRFEREVKFVITADHGITKSEGEIYTTHTERKERVLFNVSPEFQQSGLYRIDSEFAGLGQCLLPKGRYCFNEVAFAHGGLTPEEVMIPWIELTSSGDTSLDFDLGDGNPKCHELGENRWTIILDVKSAIDTASIVIKLEPPFLLQQFNWCNNGELHLIVGSSVPQVGFTEMPFSIISKGQKLFSKNLEVSFPKPIVEIDEGANDFNSMFNL